MLTSVEHEQPHPEAMDGIEQIPLDERCLDRMVQLG